MSKTIILGLLVGFPLLALAAGGGGDSSDSSSFSEPDTYSKAKSLVEDGEFEAAIPVLFDAIREDDQNADAYNLLGFTHRKTGRIEVALKYYRKALALNPRHRGAHEYLGEAFLELGDLDSAKKHLAFLDKDCTFGCREYAMLKKAIERYRSRK